MQYPGKELGATWTQEGRSHENEQEKQKDKEDEEMGESSTSSYADTMKLQLAHAPMKKSVKEQRALAERLACHESVEPALVAAATYLGQFSKLHRTKANPGGNFPVRVERSSLGFLVKKDDELVASSNDKVQH